MKCSIATLLLVLILLQTGAYYIIIDIGIVAAKHDAMNFIEKAGKDDEEGATLTFPVRDGKIIASGMIFKDEDEFTYQGRMYDVISSKKSKDQITFKCYTDNKETELTENLREKIDSDKDAPAQKQKGASILKLLLQYTPETQERFCFSTHTSTTYSITFQNRQQSFVYRTIVSPPPESTQS